jgi:phytoene dehydrogenase-like protein
VSGGIVVIGAGHNGLVAALRLAQAGHRVTVVERREVVGGLAAGEEFHPGYRSNGVWHDTAGLRPSIVSALGLAGHGLEWRPRPQLVVARPGRQTIRPSDSELASWRRAVGELRPFLARLQESPPPRMVLRGAGDFLRLGLDGLALRRLGQRRGRELLRVLVMPVQDWLLEWFDDADLAGGLAAPALLGGFVGPRAPGTAGGLLLMESSAGREVAGGAAGLVAALAAAVGAVAGIDLRLGDEVASIDLGPAGVRGVCLSSGEEVPASAIVATCDPQTALLGLLPPGRLRLRDERDLSAYRCRGKVAKLHLALAGTPRFTGDDGAPAELVRLGGLEELERASDAIKYGRLPQAPTLEVRLPSLADARLAPEGHQVASVLIDNVPHAPAGGWTEELRQRLESSVMERLEAVAPGIGALVVGAELLTPADIESRYGVTGGHLFHGETALDQLLSLRPAICAGRYRTPIEGLYLGGGGSHPGGGISGLPGWLAAGTVGAP